MSTIGPNPESSGNSGTPVCVQAVPETIMVPGPNVAPPSILLIVLALQAPFRVITRLLLVTVSVPPTRKLIRKVVEKVTDPAPEIVSVVADGIARLSPAGIV